MTRLQGLKRKGRFRLGAVARLRLVGRLLSAISRQSHVRPVLDFDYQICNSRFKSGKHSTMQTCIIKNRKSWELQNEQDRRI